MTKRNGIPDRWLNYSNVGRPIEGSPFIAFKTPLTEKYNSKLEKSKRFTPDDLIRLIPNLGLIVDLTATNRYYTARDLPSKISHIKLTMQGHVLPDERTVKKFKQIITDFREDRRNESLLIGVHCTHGVNRTGYMICKYLIDCMNLSADVAIKKFADARGYKIERDVYIRNLQLLSTQDRCVSREKEEESWRHVGRQNEQSRQYENWRSNYSSDDRYRDRKVERISEHTRAQQTYQQKWDRNRGYDQRRTSDLGNSYTDGGNQTNWRTSRITDSRNPPYAQPFRKRSDTQEGNWRDPQERNRSHHRDTYRRDPQEKFHNQYKWRRENNDDGSQRYRDRYHT